MIGSRVGYRVGPIVGPVVGVQADEEGGLGVPGIFLVGQSNTQGHDVAENLSAGNASYANTFSAIPFIQQLSVAQDPTPTERFFDGDTIHGASGTANPPSTFGTIGPHFFPGVASDIIGPECSLARQLNSNGDPAKQLARISYDGANLHTNYLPADNSPSGGPPYYFARINTFLQSTGITPLAFVWVQGENDAKLNADASVYAASMTTFWNAMFAIWPKVPLIILQLNASLDGVTYPFRDTVRAQQITFSQTYPMVSVVNCDDQTLFDNVHLSADGQVVAGQRYYTAYAAAVQTTTLSATLLDSADPVQAGGTAFSYTATVTNTGTANAASSIAYVVTLPAGVGFTSASGTGWTCTNASGVVTCTLATLAANTTSSTITINCTSPGGAGSGTATGTVVASNVAALTATSQTTTWSAPSVTKDSTSNVYLPQTSTEWQNLIALAGLTGTVAVPDWWLNCQVASGNVPDLSGNGYDLTAAGSNMTYQQSLVGWSTLGLKWINAATGTLTSTSTNLPDLSTTSICMVKLCAITGTPSATRGLFSAGTSNYVQTQISNSGPKFICADGANSLTSTNNQLTTVVPYVMQHNKTGSSTNFTTDSERLSPTISASATGKKIEYGVSSGVATAAPVWMPYGFGWKGANAEISAANLKTLLNTMLNGYLTLSWS